MALLHLNLIPLIGGKRGLLLHFPKRIFLSSLLQTNHTGSLSSLEKSWSSLCWKYITLQLHLSALISENTVYISNAISNSLHENQRFYNACPIPPPARTVHGGSHNADSLDRRILQGGVYHVHGRLLPYQTQSPAIQPSQSCRGKRTPPPQHLFPPHQRRLTILQIKTEASPGVSQPLVQHPRPAAHGEQAVPAGAVRDRALGAGAPAPSRRQKLQPDLSGRIPGRQRHLLFLGRETPNRVADRRARPGGGPARVHLPRRLRRPLHRSALTHPVRCALDVLNPARAGGR